MTALEDWGESARRNGNLGVICPKGHGYLHDLYNRIALKSFKKSRNNFEPISWEQALERFSKDQSHLMDKGPQSIFGPQLSPTKSSLCLEVHGMPWGAHTISPMDQLLYRKKCGLGGTVGELPSTTSLTPNISWSSVVIRGGIDLGQVKRMLSKEKRQN